MSGNLDMGSNKITNIKEPSEENDVASSKYVDELIIQTIDNVVKHVSSVIEKTLDNLDVASKSYVTDFIEEKFEE